MGLTVKNKTSYELGNNLTEFFSLPIEEHEINEINSLKDYNELKNNIYLLDIDIEEKANIINKINSLKNKKDKNKLIKEIENFKKMYNL